METPDCPHSWLMCLDRCQCRVAEGTPDLEAVRRVVRLVAGRYEVGQSHRSDGPGALKFEADSSHDR